MKTIEFKGTKGKRYIIEREDWFDIVDENKDRITSFDKIDERSVYDALLDCKAPEMLDMLKKVNEKLLSLGGENTALRIEIEQLIKEATEL